MCETKSDSTCSCSYNCQHNNNMFWTNKKKIEFLNHCLECLQEKEKNIHEVLNELKN
jgi:hypothetical protein